MNNLLFVGLLAGHLGQGLTPTPAAPNLQTTLADLKFISGHWQTEMNGGVSDEHWSQPLGDCMMGMYRFVKADEYQYNLAP